MLHSLINLFGKPPINPVLFYSGKIAGYITWVYLMLSISKISSVKMHSVLALDYISIALLILATIMIVIALFHLGMSTRFGLPVDETILKTKGIYRISRNPMYLGFYLLTLSAMLYTGNVWMIVLGIYSMVVYHLIILSEEKFLEGRFGENYHNYKHQVGRYL